jgi:hypothetical protein
VRDNAGHTKESGTRSARVAAPSLSFDSPFDGQGVRDTVRFRATTNPEHSDYVVRFERSIGGGPFTTVHTDDSSPVYGGTDDVSGLADGTEVTYRAVLTYAKGRTVTSDTRTARVTETPVTKAVIHYTGDPARWGLHLFGDALAPGEGTAAWENPTPFEGSDSFGVLHEMDIDDDTSRVGFIVHRRPPGDPNTKDPDNAPDRFLNPLATPEVWLRQGDVKIYNCPEANASCVVPSA